MTAENLSTIIETLIITNKADSRKLSRGLVLAYTHGDENDGVHRFTCSRKGASPSNKEMEIIDRELKAALKRRKRPFVEMQCQSFLRRGKWQYHLWEWKELHQKSLL